MATVTRLFDLLDYQQTNFPGSFPLHAKENGAWKGYSLGDFINISNCTALGLMENGIHPKDTVASISNNRPEWNFLDMGILMCGAVHVPIYPTISDKEYIYILNDAQVKIAIVSDKLLYDRLLGFKSSVPTLQEVYMFNEEPGCRNWNALVEAGKRSNLQEKLKEIKNGTQPTDLATLIYTSGTTGNPKGVMLSHHNIVSNFLACRELPTVDYRHKALSFLPLCHSYERMLTYLYMYLGVAIYYAESLEKIGDNIKEVKPHIFSAVPRLMEKVFDKFMAKGKELKFPLKNIYFWAVSIAEKYEVDGKNSWWYKCRHFLADKLIYKKWRAGLGGNVMCVVSGGAALQERIARIFCAAGIYVHEGYGLTETSPVLAVNLNRPGGTMFGTVGPVIPGVTVLIAEDGEILAKGPNIMLGYFKRPDLTAEVIDSEGWFHTGDIGKLIQGKFLKITDRKKEIFKTSGGKYIAPQPIENNLKASLFIEQAMVIGEGRNFAAALIVPAYPALEEWCRENKIEVKNHEAIVSHPKVKDLVMKEINQVNRELGKTDQIKKFEFVLKEWSQVSGELTPTLKLKRKLIFENNLALVEKIYSA